jgi:hypothetical protein
MLMSGAARCALVEVQTPISRTQASTAIYKLNFGLARIFFYLNRIS